MEAAARTALPDFASESQCRPSLKPPDIVLIHQESLVPPSLFPGLQYDRALDRFFISTMASCTGCAWRRMVAVPGSLSLRC